MRTKLIHGLWMGVGLVTTLGTWPVVFGELKAPYTYIVGCAWAAVIPCTALICLDQWLTDKAAVESQIKAAAESLKKHRAISLEE